MRLFVIYTAAFLLLALHQTEGVEFIEEIATTMVGQSYNIVTQSIGPYLVEMTYPNARCPDNCCNVGSTKYHTPYQVFCDTLDITTLDTEILIINQTSVYMNKYVESTKLGASAVLDGVELGFSFSHTSTDVNSILSSQQFNFATTTYEEQLFSLGLYPDFSLDSHFNQSLNELSLGYNQTQYFEFLDVWGTHMLQNCVYGGVVNFTAIFDVQIYESQSETWVTDQLSFYLGYVMAMFGIGTGSSTYWEELSQEFIDDSQYCLQEIGGNSTLLLTKGVPTWANSLLSTAAPILTTCSATPISTLAANPTIAANLQEAIQAYGNTNPYMAVPEVSALALECSTISY